ncbi:MAG: SprT-like domain-containing protein [Microbacterium sp.]
MAELNRVRRWGEALIKLHLDDSWSFGFDNAKRRAGQCNYTTKRITVSRYLAARFDDDEIHQVLLHEVAHALAGHKAAHGPMWKRIATELGYDGGVTHHGETAVELAPWVGTCPAGHVTYRHRRPSRATSCAKCSRSYDARFEFIWTRREITASARREAQLAR